MDAQRANLRERAGAVDDDRGVPASCATLGDVDGTWRQVARRQCGLITRAQLMALHGRRGEIQHLLARGELATEGHRGLYRVSAASWTADAARWAGVLATRSVLGYTSAAEVWQLEIPQDGRIHVIASHRRRTRMPAGVRVHRVALDDADSVIRLGTPVTTRRRTVLDCVGSLPTPVSRTVLDRALQQGWVELADLETRLRRSPKVWGNGTLRQLLAECGDGGAAESERRLHALLRDAGLDGWRANVPVVVPGGRFEVDVLFGSGLVVEVDGYAYHSDVTRFRADRRKQNALIAAGYTVLRFTWADLADRPEYVVRTIRTVLATKIGTLDMA